MIKENLEKLFLESNVKTPDAVLDIFIEYLDKNHKNDNVGYVAGPITADGSDKIPLNLKRLDAYTDLVRENSNFFIFSSNDLFTDRIFEQTNANDYDGSFWIEFFRRLLKSGLITDVFMTPRWKLSKGSIDEYETAKTQELKIHLVDPNEEVEKKLKI